MKIAAIILILLGVLGLVYGGFSYVRSDKVVDIGALEISVDRKESVPIPPILGGVALLAGIGLLVMDGRKG